MFAADGKRPSSMKKKKQKQKTFDKAHTLSAKREWTTTNGITTRKRAVRGRAHVAVSISRGQLIRARPSGVVFAFFLLNIYIRAKNIFLLYVLKEKTRRDGFFFIYNSFFTHVYRARNVGYWRFLRPVWSGLKRITLVIKNILKRVGARRLIENGKRRGKTESPRTGGRTVIDKNTSTIYYNHTTSFTIRVVTNAHVLRFYRVPLILDGNVKILHKVVC